MLTLWVDADADAVSPACPAPSSPAVPHTPAPAPPCRRIDVHDALKMGLADHAAEESSSQEVALRVAREIAQASVSGGQRLPPSLTTAASWAGPRSSWLAPTQARNCQAHWRTQRSLLSGRLPAAVQGGPVALRLAKQAISLGVELDLSSAMQLEEACYAQVGGWAPWLETPCSGLLSSPVATTCKCRSSPPRIGWRGWQPLRRSDSPSSLESEGRVGGTSPHPVCVEQHQCPVQSQDVNSAAFRMAVQICCCRGWALRTAGNPCAACKTLVSSGLAGRWPLV